jgi:hypothetical protein
MAKLQPIFVPATRLSTEDIAAIVAIGRRQAELMDELEQALDANDLVRVLMLARALVGLEHQVRQEPEMPPAA